VFLILKSRGGSNSVLGVLDSFLGVSDGVLDICDNDVDN